MKKETIINVLAIAAVIYVIYYLITKGKTANATTTSAATQVSPTTVPEAAPAMPKEQAIKQEQLAAMQDAEIAAIDANPSYDSLSKIFMKQEIMARYKSLGLLTSGGAH